MLIEEEMKAPQDSFQLRIFQVIVFFFQARLTVHMRKIGQVQLFGMDPGTWRAEMQWVWSE